MSKRSNQQLPLVKMVKRSESHLISRWSEIQISRTAVTVQTNAAVPVMKRREYEPAWTGQYKITLKQKKQQGGPAV